MANMSDLQVYLFEETFRACQRVKIEKDWHGPESVDYKIAHARFCALYGVIENGGLEDAYQEWKQAESKDSAAAPQIKCCICGRPYVGHGNNAWPIKEDGRCCDACNMSVVIPARREQNGLKPYRRAK